MEIFQATSMYMKVFTWQKAYQAFGQELRTKIHSKLT